MHGHRGVIGAECSTDADCTRLRRGILQFPRSNNSHFPLTMIPAVRIRPGGPWAPADSDGANNVAPETIYRLRTTYLEGTVPFYLTDCMQAGTITRLTETDHIAPSDFLFHVKPGLANPNDPSLVSFESVSRPGQFLRIDSANLTSATRAVATGAYAWDLNPTYDHLTWFDAFADTTGFKADATFKMTAALNGDATLVSFQWYNDQTRYLRHQSYHVFALPPTTDQENNDSSFAFEVQPGGVYASDDPPIVTFMKMASRTIALWGVCTLAAMGAHVAPAFAALGDDVSAVERDRARMNGHVQVRRRSNYDIHEIATPMGSTVRELVSRDGKVFAVTWFGEWRPDLRDVMGQHYERFNTRTQGKLRARGPVRIELPGLVVYLGGYLRTFWGHVYLSDQLPAGFSPRRPPVERCDLVWLERPRSCCAISSHRAPVLLSRRDQADRGIKPKRRRGRGRRRRRAGHRRG